MGASPSFYSCIIRVDLAANCDHLETLHRCWYAAALCGQLPFPLNLRAVWRSLFTALLDPLLSSLTGLQTDLPKAENCIFPSHQPCMLYLLCKGTLNFLCNESLKMWIC